MRPQSAFGALILAAAATFPGASRAGGVQNDAPLVFHFNPQDVPKYDAVVVTACGLDFADLKQAVLEQLFAHDAGQMAAAAPRWSRLKAAVPSETNNAYLEDALNLMLTAAGKHYLVVPLPWSRNVKETAHAEAQMRAWLPKVYAATSSDGKPLYVVGHSWGTVLLHHVLTTLAAQGSPVRVDKLITLGSPLVPSDALIKLFDGLELPPQDFGAQAAKPANVAVWRNFWGARDIFSNEIPAADENYRVDGGADTDNRLLVRACMNSLLDTQAVTDLATMDNFNLWHASYYAGYNQFFPTLQSRLDLDVPDTEVMPNSF